MNVEIGVEIIVAVLTLLAAPGAAALSWRLMKRNHTAQAETSYAQAANLSVDTMLHVLEQLREEVSALREENRALHREVQRLRELVKSLGGTA
jgi:flagellar basal body-associated protein FliL